MCGFSLHVMSLAASDRKWHKCDRCKQLRADPRARWQLCFWRPCGTMPKKLAFSPKVREERSYRRGAEYSESFGRVPEDCQIALPLVSHWPVLPAKEVEKCSLYLLSKNPVAVEECKTDHGTTESFYHMWL